MFWSPAWWCEPLTVSCYCSVSPRLSPWFTYLGFLLFLTSLTNVSISCLVMWASNSFLLLFSSAVIVSSDLPTSVSYCSWRVWQMFRSPAWWYEPPTVFCYCSVVRWLSPPPIRRIQFAAAWRRSSWQYIPVNKGLMCLRSFLFDMASWHNISVFYVLSSWFTPLTFQHTCYIFRNLHSLLHHLMQLYYIDHMFHYYFFKTYSIRYPIVSALNTVKQFLFTKTLCSHKFVSNLCENKVLTNNF